MFGRRSRLRASATSRGAVEMNRYDAFTGSGDRDFVAPVFFIKRRVQNEKILVGSPRLQDFNDAPINRRLQTVGA
jgi:hypothetical protein